MLNNSNWLTPPGGNPLTTFCTMIIICWLHLLWQNRKNCTKLVSCNLSFHSFWSQVKSLLKLPNPTILMLINRIGILKCINQIWTSTVRSVAEKLYLKGLGEIRTEWTKNTCFNLHFKLTEAFLLILYNWQGIMWKFADIINLNFSI